MKNVQAKRKRFALIMVTVLFFISSISAFAPGSLAVDGISASAILSIKSASSDTSVFKRATDIIITLNTDPTKGGVQLTSSDNVYVVLENWGNFYPTENGSYVVWPTNKDGAGITDENGDGFYDQIKFTDLRNDGGGAAFVFTIHYKDSNGNPKSNTFTYTLPDLTGWVIEPNPDSPGDPEDPVVLAALTPHLIVSSYSYPGSKVTAGTDFTLTYTLKNTSSDKAIRNVILVVTPSADLRIKSNANTFHIDRIPAGGTVERSIVLNLPVAAEQEIQNVDIAVTFQYYDKPEEDPVSGGDEIIITIPSGRITRAKITEVKIPKNFSIGKEGNIEFSVINNGFSQIYNVEAFVYDGEDNELGWLYLGHMEGGAQPIKQQLPLTFQEGGYYDLRLVVQYEDENLQMTTLEKDFVIDIEIPQEPDIWYPEPEPDPNEGLEPEPEEKSKINPILIAAIIVVVLAAGVVIFVKIKRKREDSFDDYFDSFEAGTPEKKAMDTETPKKDEILEDAKKKDKRGKKADKQ